MHKDLGNHQSSAHSFRNSYRLSAKHVRVKSNVNVDDDEEDTDVERMKYLALAVEQSNKACDWRRL